MIGDLREQFAEIFIGIFDHLLLLVKANHEIVYDEWRSLPAVHLLEKAPVAVDLGKRAGPVTLGEPKSLEAIPSRDFHRRGRHGYHDGSALEGLWRPRTDFGAR